MDKKLLTVEEAARFRDAFGREARMYIGWTILAVRNNVLADEEDSAKLHGEDVKRMAGENARWCAVDDARWFLKIGREETQKYLAEFKEGGEGEKQAAAFKAFLRDHRNYLKEHSEPIRGDIVATVYQEGSEPQTAIFSGGKARITL